MVTDSPGPQARVDAAEQHPQPGANNVRKGCAGRRSQIVGSRPALGGGGQMSVLPLFGFYLPLLWLGCAVTTRTGWPATCYPRRWCRQS